MSEGATSRVWHRGPKTGKVRGRVHWGPHHVEDPPPENMAGGVAQFALQGSPRASVRRWQGETQTGGRVDGHRGLRGSATVSAAMQEVGG